jgi:hypothetical protein
MALPLARYMSELAHSSMSRALKDLNSGRESCFHAVYWGDWTNNERSLSCRRAIAQEVAGLTMTTTTNLQAIRQRKKMEGHFCLCDG